MGECIYWSIKNPKASRALKWALDPGHRLLASLAQLCFAKSATLSLRSWGHPLTKSWICTWCFQLCVSVSLSVHRVPHVTINHDALDLTIQGPLALALPSPLLVTSDGQVGRFFQTCSLEDPTQTVANIWWVLWYIQWAGGQYASYWNVFFFLLYDLNYITVWLWMTAV